MKLGIVGTGKIAREVLPLLPDCGWIPSALCSTQRSYAVCKRLCSEYGITQSFYDYDEFLQNADVDAVYLAIPNSLHFDYARRALSTGNSVILEKPFTSNFHEARQLAALAQEKNLFLFEAISTLYLPNYARLHEWLPRIGTVKIVSCNFSQYSSRYDAFRAGTIAPAFDPKQSGGALMDLNVYNLHYISGLFSAPLGISYQANMERGIDTSGVLTLHYDGFEAVSIAAKDCSAPSQCVIQGTNGYLMQATPSNQCGEILLHLNDGTEERFDDSPSHRLVSEFRFFAEEIACRDTANCYAALEHSLLVCRLLTQARESAEIVFP